jgi:hypothetical protein
MHLSADECIKSTTDILYILLQQWALIGFGFLNFYCAILVQIMEFFVAPLVYQRAKSNYWSGILPDGFSVFRDYSEIWNYSRDWEMFL